MNPKKGKSQGIILDKDLDEGIAHRLHSQTVSLSLKWKMSPAPNSEAKEVAYTNFKLQDRNYLLPPFCNLARHTAVRQDWGTLLEPKLSGPKSRVSNGQGETKADGDATGLWNSPECMEFLYKLVTHKLSTEKGIEYNTSPLKAKHMYSAFTFIDAFAKFLQEEPLAMDLETSRRFEYHTSQTTALECIELCWMRSAACEEIVGRILGNPRLPSWGKARLRNRLQLIVHNSLWKAKVSKKYDWSFVRFHALWSIWSSVLGALPLERKLFSEKNSANGYWQGWAPLCHHFQTTFLVAAQIFLDKISHSVATEVSKELQEVATGYCEASARTCGRLRTWMKVDVGLKKVLFAISAGLAVFDQFSDYALSTEYWRLGHDSWGTFTLFFAVFAYAAYAAGKAVFWTSKYMDCILSLSKSCLLKLLRVDPEDVAEIQRRKGPIGCLMVLIFPLVLCAGILSIVVFGFTLAAFMCFGSLTGIWTVWEFWTKPHRRQLLQERQLVMGRQEILLEAVPQLVLQLYVIATQSIEITPTLLVSVLLSLLSAAKGVIALDLKRFPTSTGSSSSCSLVVVCLCMFRCLDVAFGPLCTATILSIHPQWMIYILVLAPLVLFTSNILICGARTMRRGGSSKGANIAFMLVAFSWNVGPLILALVVVRYVLGSLLGLCCSSNVYNNKRHSPFGYKPYRFELTSMSLLLAGPAVTSLSQGLSCLASFSPAVSDYVAERAVKPRYTHCGWLKRQSVFDFAFARVSIMSMLVTLNALLWQGIISPLYGPTKNLALMTKLGAIGGSVVVGIFILLLYCDATQFGRRFTRQMDSCPLTGCCCRKKKTQAEPALPTFSHPPFKE